MDVQSKSPSLQRELFHVDILEVPLFPPDEPLKQQRVISDEPSTFEDGVKSSLLVVGMSVPAKFSTSCKLEVVDVIRSLISSRAPEFCDEDPSFLA